MTLDRDWIKDAAERVGWTFLQGALATGSLEQLATGDLDAWRAAAVGGVAAVLALVKAIAARRVGDVHSAATLSTAKQPPPGGSAGFIHYDPERGSGDARGSDTSEP